MERDPRYKAVKHLVDKGEIMMFNQIFDFIPKSKVAADLGIQNVRFTSLMNHIERFSLQELFILAKFFELDDRSMFNLAYNQYLQQKGSKKA